MRTAISDNRIEQVTLAHVTYRYTPTGKKRPRRREVAGEAFTRSFLQHVLPSRFQKVRHYGFLSPNCRTDFEQVRMLVWFYLHLALLAGQPPRRAAAAPRAQAQ